MNALRLRFGLHWRGKYPPMWKPLMWFAVFMALTYLANWQSEQESKQRTLIQNLGTANFAIVKYQSMLDMCLNGGIIGRNGTTVLQCDPVREINLGAPIRIIKP